MKIPALSSDPVRILQPAIGFTVIQRGTPQELTNSQAALQRALNYFDDITQRTFDLGQTHLVVWGRGDLDRSSHIMADGSVLILVGSPNGNFTWEAISEKVLEASHTNPFMLPWEGRVILLRIDATGNTWTLWNDWLGSIPVFHAKTSFGRIASTLEPVVTGALGVGESDIFLPGLLALLMWGNYFSDWTLFKSVKVIPPDSEIRWIADEFQSIARSSVLPSDERWQAGWDEIMEEMYVLSKGAIASVLKEQPRWILPLSSGLDSRLIAGVAAETGVDVSAYTWGTLESSDVVHARNTARVLGIPWKYLRPGNTYLTFYRDQWADLFGSSMHFHGMYQMPFLDALKHEQPGNVQILSGFIGECLTGYDVRMLCDVEQTSLPYQIMSDGYLHWTIPELRELMIVPIDAALAELSAEYERELNMIEGPLYQRLRMLILRGRQRHFTYFQSMMSAYWRGVGTPYINRSYARYSFSLPRAVLDERIMQKMMFARYYPKLASIPGDYAYEPALLTGGYLLKKRMAKYLPSFITKSIFPGLFRVKSNSDVQCVTHDGRDAFHPVFDSLDRLGSWMNTDFIEMTYRNILSKKDVGAVRRLQSIQTLAYRMLA